MSYKYGEIIKKPHMTARGLPISTQAIPPPPPHRESAELTRGKRADAGCEREIQTQNWDAENEGKGGK